MNIPPNETLIIGTIRFVNGAPGPDENWKRIDDLTGKALIRISHDHSGWDALYLDPLDGRLWERTHPHSDRHGGPPELRHVLRGEVAAKYGLGRE